MGGFFGAVSKHDAIADVFFGTDYHSHLGTRRGGIAAYDSELGLQRDIHNIENTPFRTKFDNVFDEMKGNSAIGVISDSDPQPLLIMSEVGTYAIATIGRINNAEVLIEKYKKLTALNENYIVIVPFHSEDFSAEFTAAFGDKALNVRDYFMHQAHKDYGVTLSKLDGYCIKKDMIPGTYNYEGERGDYRLNEIGYKILGDLVYKKGQELGYWK